MRIGEPCFHCQERIPAGTRFVASVGGVERAVCCAGCQAVAEFIDGQGLNSFYEHRQRPAALDRPAAATDWSHYDDGDLMQRYVHVAEDEAEATIDIGGMYCSSCVWLLQTALLRHAAIADVAVNPSTRRAVIRWHVAQLSMSALLSEIEKLGFSPQPIAVGMAADSGGDERRLAMRRLLVAAIAGMQVMMFAVALYAGEHFGIDGTLQRFLRAVSLMVCVPIVVYSARPFFVGAIRGLRGRHLGMDLPVALAILIAFVASAYNTLNGSGEIYFDSVAMFVLFLSATRYLEMTARRAAGDTRLALAQTLPETVVRVAGSSRSVVPLDAVRVGDLLSVRSGDIVPVDARVLSGELLVDESVLTGESAPILRRAGAEVYAGSVNPAGVAIIEVLRSGANTNIAEVGRLLARAQADRPPIAVLADRVAGRFVAAMLAIAAATGWVWMQWDPTRVLESVLATLVVTCPCALALATPAALAAATSRLTHRGLLLVRSRVLERLAVPATLVFDKTGTLTRGKPEVVHTAILDGERAPETHELLGLVAAIERQSEHVLARAFASHDALDCRIKNVRPVLGQGIEAHVDGTRYRVGRPQFVAAMSGVSADLSEDDDIHTAVWLGDDDGPLARFLIADALRPDARAALSTLRELGHRIVIASGDRQPVVARVAQDLDVFEWHASLTPADKLELVADLQREGHAVVMIGDGINDAPVLAAADASIAVDAGTALARASADSILLGARLGALADSAVTAVATRRIIRQNIVWAIAYNLTAVPLAASGVLAPWMAAIGMSASSLLVVLNALRLRRRVDGRHTADTRWRSAQSSRGAPA